MTDPFDAGYADAYDALYEDKDYRAECDALARVFDTYSASDIKSVLDLGCGTGSHAVELAQRGFDVVGIDRSASMLRHARAKTSDASYPGEVSFEQGDIRDLDLGRRFGAVIMMFAVLGYQTENRELLAALCTARRHLVAGGLLAFDCWYGPAVLRQGPSQRAKIVDQGTERILRIAAGVLDTGRGICAVDYRLWRLSGDRLIAESEEQHLVRYLFAPEIDLFLTVSGFELLRLGSFPDFDQDPDGTSWNVLAVARAVDQSARESS